MSCLLTLFASKSLDRKANLDPYLLVNYNIDIFLNLLLETLDLVLRKWVYKSRLACI